MKHKNLLVCFLTFILLITLPFQSALAKEKKTKSWLEGSFNPTIEEVIKNFNSTLKSNWFLNLSNYLLEEDKDSTIKQLEMLRSDIKELKKDVKEIKPPKSAEKQDKKSIKVIKKQLNKALSRTDKDAKKLIKRINKGKEIKTISKRSVEKRNISKVNDKYMELNKRYENDIAALELDEFIKINEDIAKNFINEQKKEKKKIEEKKKKEKEEVKKQKIEDDFLASIDNSTVTGKSQIIIYEIFKDGYTEPEEIITNIEFAESEKVLSATVKGKDGWSDNSIGLGFYEDSTSVYRELAKDDRIDEVWLTITFPMQDIYGNVDDEEVMVTWMSRETMDKINWKSFNYQNLLDVVDGKRIYPQFVQ